MFQGLSFHTGHTEGSAVHANPKPEDISDCQSPSSVPCSLIKCNVFDLFTRSLSSVGLDQSISSSNDGLIKDIYLMKTQIDVDEGRDSLKHGTGIRWAYNFDHGKSGKEGYTY